MAPPAPVFDAHLHIVDPRFPLWTNQGFTPEPFPVDAYRAQTAGLDVQGGAVVSGSFQRHDQAYLLDALARLGPRFVGVTQLPASVTDAEIRRLDAAGVRAVRFNLRRGGAATPDEMPAFAARAHAVAGWHAEVYADGADLPALAPVLQALPCVVIDHLGLRAAGQDALLRLMDGGAYVKATGFGRLDFAAAPFLRRLVAARPDRLLFGTDLPSTRAPRAFQASDLALVREVAGEHADAVCRENAMRLYRPRAASGPA